MQDDANDSIENSVTEVESMCTNCHEDAVTRLLLTTIPYFRDVVVSSSYCEHCGYRDTAIQNAGMIGEMGVKYTVSVASKEDLNRQVVKSETAVITIPELELELPAVTQTGSLNTIEGILRHTAESLSNTQAERAVVDPEATLQIAQFIMKVQEYADGDHLPFTFIIDDLAGNSFVQNPNAPKEDHNAKKLSYQRTREQDIALNYIPPPEEAPEEVMQFPSVCEMCDRMGYMKSIVTNIPHFKEVIIMAFYCNQCGYKTNEVKVGGAISDHGKRLVLRVENQEDLSRDVLKSDSTSVYIPEIDLELAPGTLGAKFTTVEGLLRNLVDTFEKLPFVSGDSGDTENKNKIKVLAEKLESLLTCDTPFTLIFDDPLANSYVQNLYAPDPDPQLDDVTYERTEEQNDDLGITELLRQEALDKQAAKAQSAAAETKKE